MTRERVASVAPIGVFAWRSAGLGRGRRAGAERALWATEGADPLHADGALARLTLRTTLTPG